jgi:hypothetical protein
VDVGVRETTVFVGVREKDVIVDVVGKNPEIVIVAGKLTWT